MCIQGAVLIAKRRLHKISGKALWGLVYINTALHFNVKYWMVLKYNTCELCDHYAQGHATSLKRMG